MVSPLYGYRNVADWHLYILNTADNRLYTGITTDVERRFNEHCSGGGKAAKAVRHRQPLTLCYQTLIGPRSLALRAEYRLKRLPRQRKQALVVAQPDRTTLLALLDLDPDTGDQPAASC